MASRKPSRPQQYAHRRKVDAAFNARMDASSAVNKWAIANGHGNVRWSDIRPIAPAGLMTAYDKADAKHDGAMRAAVAAGCAYWASGRFAWIHW